MGRLNLMGKLSILRIYVSFTMPSHMHGLHSFLLSLSGVFLQLNFKFGAERVVSEAVTFATLCSFRDTYAVGQFSESLKVLKFSSPRHSHIAGAGVERRLLQYLK